MVRFVGQACSRRSREPFSMQRRLYPWESPWGAPRAQQVLNTALAWAVLNRQFEIADFLLQHGADFNTRWSSREPASILHELVFREDYEAMQFLIDRGIDMTIEDYRWGGTVQDWADRAAKNERMVDFLAAAERKQKERSP
jgi:ankyrin repeat protein